MTIFTLMLAAATMMTGQQAMAGFVTGESAYAGLEPEEKERRLTEHKRLGETFTETFGFAFGEAFDSYSFQPAQTNVNYVLPRPALGFSEFLPFITEGRLCGFYLKREAGRDEDGDYSEELFDVERWTSLTNLAVVLSVQTNNLSIATNGVPHVWRISYEKWRTALVLRICDEELSRDLSIEAEKQRLAEEAKRQAELMRALEKD